MARQQPNARSTSIALGRTAEWRHVPATAKFRVTSRGIEDQLVVARRSWGATNPGVGQLWEALGLRAPHRCAQPPRLSTAPTTSMEPTATPRGLADRRSSVRSSATRRSSGPVLRGDRNRSVYYERRGRAPSGAAELWTRRPRAWPRPAAARPGSNTRRQRLPEDFAWRSRGPQTLPADWRKLRSGQGGVSGSGRLKAR
jgi:hypothetical protein